MYDLEGERKEKARKKLRNYVWFKPMPEVSRASLYRGAAPRHSFCRKPFFTLGGRDR